MSTTGFQTLGSQGDASIVERSGRYLYGPAIDFLLLGGGSLLALLALRFWLGDGETATTTSLALTLALANLINHPHFAHSYQIFYSGYRAKLLSQDYAPSLRLRYLLTGIAAPIALGKV